MNGVVAGKLFRYFQYDVQLNELMETTEEVKK